MSEQVKLERVYLQIDIDPAEKRDFYHGRDQSPADIDWAFHLRMGDLRFVEGARLATVPGRSAILAQRDKEWREALLGGRAVELLAERLYRFAALQQGWRMRWPETSESTKISWREDARLHLASLQAAIDKAAPNGGGE